MKQVVSFHQYFFERITTYTARTNKAIPAVIHTGDNTHHQDHVITLHNFKVIKTIVSNPVNPIPLLDEFEFDIYFIFKVYNYCP